MDGEAGWWTTSGNIGLPPLARAMGVGRQQQPNATTKSTQQRYGEELRQKNEQNVLTNMVQERARTVTTATYEAVYTDQEFTISELEGVLDRLKDTTPGEDTVCYSMIKNTPLSTVHLFLRLNNQSFSERRLPTR